MQKELVAIFKRLKRILKQYKNPLVPKYDLDSMYDIWSKKNVVIAGRKRKEVYFAGLIIQSSYVGFYYMPVYTDEDLKTLFKPEMLKILKGKSCFHVKKLDSKLEKQIQDVLKRSYGLYKKRGWI